MVMVIVIMGVIAGMVAVFISSPVKGYVDSVRRAELTDAADVALRRISRDVRLALPNSLRVMNSGGSYYIEFIMTSTGGRYRDSADGSTGGHFLSFTDITVLSFDVLGTMPSSPAIAINDYVVVYNLGEGYSPADAYAAADPCTSCNRAKVSGISGNVVTLASNPFATQSPPLPSPNMRFQVVPGSTKAVSYACPATGATAGNLSRYANYGFNATQSASSLGTGAVLAAGATCTVDYTSAATGRNGLLYISLTLTDASSQESVTLFQEIHVDNSP
jgi:MSHA biogenesis protein MshO